MAQPHGGKVLGSLRKVCGYGFEGVQAIAHVGRAWVQSSLMWVSARGVFWPDRVWCVQLIEVLLWWSGARWPWRLLSLARASPPSRVPPSGPACRVCASPTRRCPLWDWAQFPPCLPSFPPPQTEFPNTRLQAPHWQVSFPFHMIIIIAISRWITRITVECLLPLHIQKGTSLQSTLSWGEGLNGRSHRPSLSLIDALAFQIGYSLE